jgi:protein disulfide-isomerase
MKKWMVLLAVAMVGTGAFAAGEGWETNFEKAAAKAKAEGKHMLVDFSGSDWCSWCVKLDTEVFSKEEFKAYAKENLVLVLADFPRDKSKQSAALQKQNEQLAEKYGIRGFPTVYILNPEGNAIDKTGYQAGGPEAYVEYIKKVIAAAKK